MTPERAIEIADRLAELARSAPWTAPIGMTAGYVYQRCARCERGGRRVAVSTDVISGQASDEHTERYFADRFSFLSAHLSCPVHESHLMSEHPALSIVRSVFVGMDLDHIAGKIALNQAMGCSPSIAWSCLGCYASIVQRYPSPGTIDATRVGACRGFCEAHMACSTAAWKRRPN